MHDCTVTHVAGRSEITAVVVGHCSARLPKAVEAIAARLAKGDLSGAQHLVTPDGRYLLVKPDDKPWLVGGEPWRLVGKEVVDAVRAAKATDATVLVQGSRADVPALVEGLLLADYRYNLLRSGKDAKRARITVRLPGHATAVAAGTATAGAQNLARELCDTPPNLANPATVAERARREAREVGLEVRQISGVKALTKAGFPGLVQVGKAGSAEPVLVELRHRPKKAKAGVRLHLVGKGITFDTGGISLKPGDKMWEMKGDMGGAAAVLAAMRLIAQRKLPVEVTGWLCLAENMPDSDAQRPGDIYRTRTGTTVHVDNTDAEGRLVLADVLAYACEQGATHLVDVATLTGACLVALGEQVAGVMGRDEGFTGQVRAAGQAAGEELWPLPLYGEYRRLLDHPHADINNIGGRYGGAITAGLFLAEFVKSGVKWAHCDIAGPAIQSGGWRYYAKGMTGFSTRTLAELAGMLGR